MERIRLRINRFRLVNGLISEDTYSNFLVIVTNHFYMQNDLRNRENEKSKNNESKMFESPNNTMAIEMNRDEG